MYFCWVLPGGKTESPPDPIAALEEALRQEPESKQLRLRLAVSLCEAERCAEAVAVLAPLPEDFEPIWSHFWRGKALTAAGRPKEALAVLRQAVALRRPGGKPRFGGSELDLRRWKLPNHVDNLGCALGAAHQELGELDAARRWFEEGSCAAQVGETKVSPRDPEKDFPGLARRLARPRRVVVKEGTIPEKVLKRPARTTDAPLPEGLKESSVVYRGQQGRRVVFVTLSQDLDPRGELSRGGYWAYLSESGGESYEGPFYLGISQYYPYVVQAESPLLPFEGKRLRLPVEVKELDEDSISFPPGQPPDEAGGLRPLSRDSPRRDPERQRRRWAHRSPRGEAGHRSGPFGHRPGRRPRRPGCAAPEPPGRSVPSRLAGSSSFELLAPCRRIGSPSRPSSCLQIRPRPMGRSLAGPSSAASAPSSSTRRASAPS